MGSCQSSKKPLLAQDNLELFSLVWLDDVMEKVPKQRFLRRQFRMIVNYLQIFSNEFDCQKYLTEMSSDEYVILVIKDQIGEKIIPHVHQLPQIFSIYICSSNENIDQSWTSQFNKIKSICSKYDELLNELQIDQIRCRYLKNPILFDIFQTDKVIEFFYSQILIDVLLQMDPMVNDTINLISLSRNQYHGNKTQLKILREFTRTYSSDQAILWLTRDTFIAEIFNKALKRRNLDLLFLFRFLIHDLEHELEKTQYLRPIKVYRYQLMPKKEFQLLKESIGQFISLKNFLLTSTNRRMVSFSWKVFSDDQPVLFEITADFRQEGIRAFGKVPSRTDDHDEVLFMLGSIFQLDNICQDDHDMWIVEMTLTSRANEHFKSAIDDLKIDQFEEEASLLSFGLILYKMNQFEETEKYYHRLFNELHDDDDRLACCCLNLGNLACLRNEYDSSLQWLFKSLEITLRTFQSNEQFLAPIYSSMGQVYVGKDEWRSAIQSYNKAIIIWKQAINENYFNIAKSMHNIGIIYKQKKEYSLALECFQQTLFILKKYPSHEHFDLGTAHCNIASVYRQLGQYDMALEHYHQSLVILEKYNSASHPKLAKVLGNIGIVHALKGQ